MLYKTIPLFIGQPVSPASSSPLIKPFYETQDKTPLGGSTSQLDPGQRRLVGMAGTPLLLLGDAMNQQFSDLSSFKLTDVN